MTTYGYARVSTQKQSLDSQVNDLMQTGVPADHIFAEHFTGTTANRPMFQRCLSVLKPGDVLVVTKLDRFARSAKDALDTVDMLRSRGVQLKVLNLGVTFGNKDDPANQLLFTMMSGFADFERDLILSRMREGHDWAKANDPSFREGRPSTPETKLRWAAQLRQQGYTWRHIAKETGVSRATLYRHMNTIKEYMNMNKED